jgi:hypothetical protein
MEPDSFITVMILGGTEPEAEWTRISVAGFLRYCPGQLLVVDNTPKTGHHTLRWLEGQDRITIIRNPCETVLWNGMKSHGQGYDVALKWCRENGIEKMVSLEADCRIEANDWHKALLAAVGDDCWMAGLFTLSDKSEHHTPACYLTRVEWPTFAWGSNAAEKDDPRFMELVDWETKKEICLKNYGRVLWDTFTSVIWDTGQCAWFYAASRDKMKHLDLPLVNGLPGGVHHYWMGTTTAPKDSLLAPWLHEHYGGELLHLFQQHETDKGIDHQYHRIYEWLLRPYRTRACRFLELGVGFGSSIAAWNEYMPDAWITGADVDLTRINRKIRANLQLGDLNDPSVRSSICTFAPYDIIIDDANHEFDSQRACFDSFWPFVSYGGVYVIEDLQASPQCVEWCVERIRAEAENCTPPDRWTIFAGELVAFVKIPRLP